MIDNFALGLAHFCMGYFLWKVVLYEGARRQEDAASRVQRMKKARR